MSFDSDMQEGFRELQSLSEFEATWTNRRGDSVVITRGVFSLNSASLSFLDAGLQTQFAATLICDRDQFENSEGGHDEPQVDDSIVYDEVTYRVAQPPERDNVSDSITIQLNTP